MERETETQRLKQKMAQAEVAVNEAKATKQLSLGESDRAAVSCGKAAVYAATATTAALQAKMEAASAVAVAAATAAAAAAASAAISAIIAAVDAEHRRFYT